MDALFLAKGLFVVSVVKALIQNPARSLFALCGVSLGIASLVFIVAAIEGSNLHARQIIEFLGPDTIFIHSGFGRRRQMRRLTSRLDITDYENLQKIEGVRAAAYMLTKKKRITNGLISRDAYIFGATEDFLKVFDYHVQKGLLFKASDYSAFPKICIIGPELAEFLFDSNTPLRKSIKIARTQFQIIGIYKSRGKLPSGKSLDDRVIIPINTYRKFLDPEYRRVSGIKLKLDPQANYDHIVLEVKLLLGKRHKKEDVVIVTPETVRKFLNLFNWTLSLYLSLTSLIALFISGFVMSNIFSINMRVRAWEIGIRRALGASKKAIILQFLSEAIIISLSGAIIGSIIGFLAIRWLTPFLNIPTVYPFKSLFLALTFSITTGLLSVFIPAKSASKLNPVKALKARI